MRKYYGSAPVKDPEPEPRHDYSSTQCDITGPAATAMRKMAAAIPDADLNAEEGGGYGGKSASDGREHDFHITAKWGLHFMTPSARLRNAIKEFGPIRATLGKTSLFSNDDADVLKVDVDSADLHRLNALISKMVPTHETHPVYIPHATIAYLKPGKGKQYAGDKSLAGKTLTFDHVMFSGKNGHMEAMPLTGGAGYRVKR